MFFAAIWMIASSYGSWRDCLDLVLTPFVGPRIRVEYRTFSPTMDVTTIASEAERVFSEPLGKERAQLIGQFWAAREQWKADAKPTFIDGEMFRSELQWMKQETEKAKNLGKKSLENLEDILHKIDATLQQSRLNYFDALEATELFAGTRQFEEHRMIRPPNRVEPIWISHEISLDDLIAQGGAPIDPIQIFPFGGEIWADGIAYERSKFVGHDLNHASSDRSLVTKHSKTKEHLSFGPELANRFAQRVYLNKAFLTWANAFDDGYRELVKVVWFQLTHETARIPPNGRIPRFFWLNRPRDLLNRALERGFLFSENLLEQIQNQSDLGQIFKIRNPDTITHAEVKNAIQFVKSFLNRIRWVEK